MRRTLAYILLAVGLAVVSTGIILAVLEFGAMYTRATEDALGDPMFDEQTEVPRRMLFRLGIAALGTPPLLIGVVLWWSSKLRRTARDPLLQRSKV